MNKRDMIESIIYLPGKFYDAGDKSMHALLKETGYFEIFAAITEDDIYTAVNLHPNVVDKWMIWSENKRTTSGWFLMKEGGKYVVNFLPVRIGFDKLQFSDHIRACAAFIKREIEEIRNHQKA